MLVSGSRGAPHKCLRCQLRQAIFHTRRRCIDRTPFEKARYFSTTPRPQDQEDDSPIKVSYRDDRPYVYHHPLGRIVGAPGRRQRQGTQKLKIDAMKQPFEVIVMQDVREPEERPRRPRNMQGGAVVSAADIEREMAKEGKDPTQDEVNESINALRPDTTLLDGEQYKTLAKSLSDGFTNEQLHAFFTQSLNLSAVKGDTVHLLRQQPSELQARYRRTQWRPGRTRLEKRLPLGAVVKKSEKTNKPKLAEQILRLTWNLSIHAEEQQLGEIEMKVESWELKYLFDLPAALYTNDSRAMYQTLVGSAFLLRACEIRPYRPQGYLRITGRRQDAEEVAKRLELKLPAMQRQHLNLNAFTPLLGTQGWPASLDKLFRAEDIKYIQSRTLTVIEQPRPDTLHIYSNMSSRQVEARRLLLAFLELPTAGSTTLLHNGAFSARAKAVPLPEAAGPAMHLRHRHLALTRPTLPSARVLDGMTKTITSQKPLFLAKWVYKELAKFPWIAPPSLDLPRSQWEVPATKVTRWAAQLCRVLHSSHYRKERSLSPNAAADHHHLTIVNSQTHHLETLLSFFVPRMPNDEAAKVRVRPLLIARFIPSPFHSLGIKGLSTLPTIELAYNFFTNEDGTPDLWLARAQAKVQVQDTCVSLPSEVTDVRFERSSIILAKGSRLQHDSTIQQFTRILRESLRTKGSHLVGKSEVTFRIPAAWVRGDEVGLGTPDEEYHYMFTGFEQTQMREYSPVDESALPAKTDAESKELLASFGENVYLQLKEVSAGSVGGKRTEVFLRRVARPRLEEQRRSDGSSKEVENDDLSAEAADERPVQPETVSTKTQKGADGSVVKTALGLARFLTKISTGAIQPLLRQEAQPRVEDEQTEGAVIEEDRMDEAADKEDGQ